MPISTHLTSGEQVPQDRKLLDKVSIWVTVEMPSTLMMSLMQNWEQNSGQHIQVVIIECQLRERCHAKCSRAGENKTEERVLRRKGESVIPKAARWSSKKVSVVMLKVKKAHTHKSHNIYHGFIQICLF